MSHHQGQNGRPSSDKVEDPTSGIQIPPTDKAIAEEVPAIPKTLAEDEVTPLGEPADSSIPLDPERYEIIEELGAGSFGTVYRVYDHFLNMDLAVKTPAKEVARFYNEAYALLDLGLHPNITSCIYVNTLEDDIPRMFIEYVEGRTLVAWLQDGKITDLKTALDIGIQICWGLGWAHKRGLVHRDVTPANILMTPGGMPKVTDFGLVKIVREEEEQNPEVVERNPSSTKRTGTPGYAAPEQDPQQNTGYPITTETDVFGLGVVLYEILQPWLGWPLFPDVEAGARPTFYRRALEKYESVFAKMLWRCLAFEPGERLRNANELADRLIEIYPELIGHTYERQPPPEAELIADSLNNKAISLIDLKRPAEEIDHCFKEALDSQGDHPETLYNLCRYRWQSGKVDTELLWRLKESAWTHRDDWRYPHLVGRLWLEQGYQEAALAELQSALAKSGKNSQVEQALERIKAPRNDCIDILRGHTDGVTAVAITPDGQKAVSASLDKTLRLWDLNTGTCITTLYGHTTAIYVVAISPNGRFAVSGGADRTIRMWDLNTGECVKSTKWPGRVQGPITSIAIDGWVLVGSKSGHLGLCNINRIRDLNSFGRQLPIDKILGVAEMPQTELGTLKQVWLYRLKQLARLVLEHLDKLLVRYARHSNNEYAWTTLPEQKGQINTIVPFAPKNGDWVFTANADHTLRMWSLNFLPSLHLLSTLEGHTDAVNTLAIASDGLWALSGSADHTLQCWNISDDDYHFPIASTVLKGHSGPVTSVAISPTRPNLALSGSMDMTLRLWTVPPQKPGICLNIFTGHTGAVTSVAILPDGRRAVSASADHTLRLWNLENQLLSKTLPYLPVRPQPEVETLHFAELLWAAEQTLSKGNLEGSMRLAERARQIVGYERSRKVTKHRDRLVEAWFERAEQNWQFDLFKEAGNSIEQARQLPEYRQFRKTNDFPAKFAQRGVRRELHLRWEAKPLEGHSGEINAIAVSSDGGYALSGSSDRTLRYWNIKTQQCVRLIENHPDKITCVALFPDKPWAISGGDNGYISLWDLRTGKPLPSFKGHSAKVTAVTVSPNGCWVLSYGKSTDRSAGQLLLWDFSTGKGKFLRELKGHKGTVTSIAISPDGRWGLSGSYDGTVRLWDLASGQCLRTFVGHLKAVKSVAFLPNSQQVISAEGYDYREHSNKSDRTALRIWDLKSGQCLKKFTAPYFHPVIPAPEGCYIFCKDFSDEVGLLNIQHDADAKPVDVTYSNIPRESLNCIALTPNGQYLLRGYSGEKLVVLELDWIYDFPDPLDWDEGARPYLENFLTLETANFGIEEIKVQLKSLSPPYLRDEGFIPKGDFEDRTAFTLEQKIRQLFVALSYGGYGWLHPEGVWRELEQMVATWQGPQPLPNLSWYSKIITQLIRIKVWWTGDLNPDVLDLRRAWLMLGIALICLFISVLLWLFQKIF